MIEKDLATAVLAAELGAEQALFLTAVDRVATGWGTPQQGALETLTAAEARRLFAAGGASAIITSPERLADAMRGRAGTRIVGR